MLIEAGQCPADDRAVIGAIIESVSDRIDIERWCNFSYEIDEDAGGAPDSFLFSFLAARGPSSPLATVTSGSAGKRPTGPQLGLQHRAGQKAALQLREAGIELPGGWSWVQDHPRRGLVVELPSPVAAPAITDWLLRAMAVLNRAPTTGTMLYEVFESR